MTTMRTGPFGLALLVCALGPGARADLWFASPGGTGAGGSWADAAALGTVLADGALADGDEIRLLAGTYTVTAQLATAKALAIRGGFAGTGDQRAAGAVSVLDGRWEASPFRVTAAAGTNEFDRICFFRGLARGLEKSGAGSLLLRDCRFVNNGIGAIGTVNGRGASLAGHASSSCLVMTNCVFSGNVQSNVIISGTYHSLAGSGLGACIENFRRVLMDDCLFQTNGAPLESPVGAVSPSRDGMNGAALYLKSAPLTARGCRFIGNRATTRNARGGIVYLSGACGGSAFTNCLWLGNEGPFGWDAVPGDGLFVGTGSGTVVVNLDNAADPVGFVNCTMAYNLTDGTTSPAGLHVLKGAARIRNSIFFGNMVGSGCTVGADLYAKSAGSIDIDYSLLAAPAEICLAADSGARLAVGDHMVYGDPLFATAADDVVALLASPQAGMPKSLSRFYFDRTKTAGIMSLDAHVRSPAGRWDGTGWTADDALSRAIDTGDPQSACGAEPPPHGGRVNLGFYGNTAEASRTEGGAEVAIAGLAVTMRNGWTQPYFAVTLGGSGNYNTGVTLCFGDTDPQSEGTNGWQHVRVAAAAAQRGETVSAGTGIYFAPGTVLRYRVLCTTPSGAPVVRDGSVTVTGELPPFHGKGGPPHVIHAREGADGRGTGEDWTDALPSFTRALALLSDVKTEIWFAGTNFPAVTPTATITHAAAIRGGFAGTENAAAERAAGRVAVLDGQHGCNCLVLDNGAAAPVTLDALCFTRGTGPAFVKTGAGDLTLTGCRVEDNAIVNATACNGRGMRLAGTAGTTELVARECVFAGNVATGYLSSAGHGIAAHVSNFKRATMEDCLFAGNGVPLAHATGHMCPGRDSGLTVLYFSAAPLTARRCRFIGNRATVRNNSSGGVVCLAGASGGSAFTNCLWLANEGTYGWSSGTTGSRGGMAEVALNTADAAVDFVNCTMAYNLVDGLTSPAGINLVAGAAKIRNSIFFGNIIRSDAVTVGADIHVAGASASADIDYSLFQAESADFISEAVAGRIARGGHLLYGDPLFATPSNEVLALVVNEAGLDCAMPRSPSRFYFDTAEAERVFSFSAHLRSKAGFTDEADGARHVHPGVLSVAIDAGDPASDYRAEPAPNGRRINLGCYGNTPWASASPARGLHILLR